MNPLRAARNCWLHITISILYTLLYWFLPSEPMFTTLTFYMWFTVILFILGEACTYNHKRIKECKVILIPINPIPKTSIEDINAQACDIASAKTLSHIKFDLNMRVILHA